MMDRRIKILIVEDEQIVALDLKRRLTKLGYYVTGMAASGNKAFALVNHDLPHIILMDIHLQGEIDGVDVAARIHEQYCIPVIYVTAYSEEKTLSRASNTKPYGYLLKPFSDRELHVMIQISIERHENDVKLAHRDEEHFQLALDAAHLGTWEAREDTHEIFIQKRPKGHLELISDWKRFFALIDEDDQKKVTEYIEKLRLGSGTVEEIEFRVRPGFKASSGPDCWYKLYGKSFVHDGSRSCRIIGVLRETTENRKTRNRLAQASAVYECASEGIVLLKNRKFDCANNAFFTITGFEEYKVKGKELMFLTASFLGKAEYDVLWQSVEWNGRWQGEVKAVINHDEVMYVWLNIGRIPPEVSDGEQSVVMISDITTVRKTQEQLAHIAFYDGLTNLPNRMLVMDRLKHALEGARRASQLLGLLFLDLDGFKRINDTLGHQAGDTLLRLIAKRIQSVLRKSDTLGRLGGDEFVVVVPDIESKSALSTIAEKILNCFSAPVIIEDMEIMSSSSIGISVFPEHSDDPDGLVQMANTAMHQAKNSGRNLYAYYHPGLTQRATHYLVRERELYQALKNNEFVLYYQPQYSTADREITCVEALIRWRHPKKGLLSPAEIIPVAESSKLIIDIGNWVLTEACRQLSIWRAQGFCHLSVAVNVSIRQFSDMQFTKFINQLLRQYDLPAHYLELEITESCLQDELVDNVHIVELEKSGISISIDDFGTGYSCMSSLKHLPIHKLKIDHSFVKDIPQDKNDCAIAAAIVALAKQLNLNVIAEGIERQEQIEFLNSHGCDQLQGFLLSAPISAERMSELIEKQYILAIKRYLIVMTYLLSFKP